GGADFDLEFGILPFGAIYRGILGCLFAADPIGWHSREGVARRGLGLDTPVVNLLHNAVHAIEVSRLGFDAGIEQLDADIEFGANDGHSGAQGRARFGAFDDGGSGSLVLQPFGKWSRGIPQALHGADPALDAIAIGRVHAGAGIGEIVHG